ncbi:hypothetical protein HDU76_008045 [Blyttiomyces sp. JEL0837]|nr:hypothetical protein HDU76_008045 [Blyttiomyces sp. JEL0837]
MESTAGHGAESRGGDPETSLLMGRGDSGNALLATQGSGSELVITDEAEVRLVRSMGLPFAPSETFAKILQEKTVGKLGGIALIYNNMTGIGVIQTPLLFQQSGFFPVIFAFTIYMVISGLCALFIVEAMQAIPGNKYFQGTVEFGTMINFYFGTIPHILGQFCLFGALQSMAVSSIIQSAQTVDNLLIDIAGRTCGVALGNVNAAGLSWHCVYEHGHSISPFGDSYVLFSFGYLIVMLFVVPLCVFPLTDYIIVQVCAFGITLVIFLAWIIGAAIFGFNVTLVPVVGNLTGYAGLIGVVMLNYAFVQTVPAWVNVKKPDVNVQVSIWASVGMGLITYILIGLIPALAYSIPTDSNLIAVISVLGVWNKVFGYLFSLMVLMTSIPVFLVISRLNISQNFRISSNVSTILSYALPWIVTIPFQTGSYLLQINIWGSLIFVSTANFVVPLCIYLKALTFRRAYNQERVLTPKQRELLRIIHCSSDTIKKHLSDSESFLIARSPMPGPIRLSSSRNQQTAVSTTDMSPQSPQIPSSNPTTAPSISHGVIPTLVVEETESIPPNTEAQNLNITPAIMVEPSPSPSPSVSFGPVITVTSHPGPVAPIIVTTAEPDQLEPLDSSANLLPQNPTSEIPSSSFLGVPDSRFGLSPSGSSPLSIWGSRRPSSRNSSWSAMSGTSFRRKGSNYSASFGVSPERDGSVMVGLSIISGQGSNVGESDDSRRKDENEALRPSQIRRSRRGGAVSPSWISMADDAPTPVKLFEVDPETEGYLFEDVPDPYNSDGDVLSNSDEDGASLGIENIVIEPGSDDDSPNAEASNVASRPIPIVTGRSGDNEEIPVRSQENASWTRKFAPWLRPERGDSFSSKFFSATSGKEKDIKSVDYADGGKEAVTEMQQNDFPPMDAIEHIQEITNEPSSSSRVFERTGKLKLNTKLTNGLSDECEDIDGNQFGVISGEITVRPAKGAITDGGVCSSPVSDFSHGSHPLQAGGPPLLLGQSVDPWTSRPSYSEQRMTFTTEAAALDLDPEGTPSSDLQITSPGVMMTLTRATGTPTMEATLERSHLEPTAIGNIDLKAPTPVRSSDTSKLLPSEMKTKVTQLSPVCSPTSDAVSTQQEDRPVSPFILSPPAFLEDDMAKLDTLGPRLEIKRTGTHDRRQSLASKTSKTTRISTVSAEASGQRNSRSRSTSPSGRRYRPPSPPANEPYVAMATKGVAAFRSIPKWVPFSPRSVAIACLVLTAVTTSANLIYVIGGWGDS